MKGFYINMDKIAGSIAALNSVQITEAIAGLDAASKEVFKNKEVLAIILQYIIEEFHGYSKKQIMDFIEEDSISSPDVSTGRTNTRIHGENIEFKQLNEITSNFDILFKAKNPVLSTERVLVNLHIDLEPQTNYRPGYPIEKRGIYYLARSLSSQLSLITGQTDYSSLEKCYSIWICRDNVPITERYSISFYSIENTKNIGNVSPKKENFDLLTLIVIRLGEIEYNVDKDNEAFDAFRFLNAIMYPHRHDFMNTISDYIDFSQNEELRQEVAQMRTYGQCVVEDCIMEGLSKGLEQGIAKGLEQGIEQGLAKGLEQGLAQGLEQGLAQGREQGLAQGRQESIYTLIETFQELNIPKEMIIEKLVLKFELTPDEANKYMNQTS